MAGASRWPTNWSPSKIGGALPVHQSFSRRPEWTIQKRMSVTEIVGLVIFGGGALAGWVILPGFWTGQGRGGVIEANWALATRDSEQRRRRAMRSFPAAILAMTAGVVGWVVGGNATDPDLRAVSAAPFAVLFAIYWVVFFMGRPRFLVPPRYRDDA